MKKVAIVVFILGLLVLLFACSKNKQPRKVATEINWQIEVDYLDNTRDTLIITTKDGSESCGCGGKDKYQPEMDISNGISVMTMNYEIKASYIKTFRVLSKVKIK